MNYLLDTNACVFAIRGKYNMPALLAAKGHQCKISEMSVLELRFGAENSQDPLKSHAVLDAFLKNFAIVPLAGVASLYAQEKVRLRRMGKPMNDEFDLLIGVTAIYHNLILVTENVSDFQNMKGIQIENWIRRQ
jgi:tRNA(fMet)-specific endonuclease VapC